MKERSAGYGLESGERRLSARCWRETVRDLERRDMLVVV